MRVSFILALLAIASPAFAQAAQDQKPFLYDKLLPKDGVAPVRAPAPTVTITAGGASTPSPAPDAKKADPNKPLIYDPLLIRDPNRSPLPVKTAPKVSPGPGIG